MFGQILGKCTFGPDVGGQMWGPLFLARLDPAPPRKKVHVVFKTCQNGYVWPDPAQTYFWPDLIMPKKVHACLTVC